MPLFKVTLTKVGPSPSGRNPFLANISALRVPVRERDWEFEADSETEVRRLYEEAVRLHIPNVDGFQLSRIQRVYRPDECTCHLNPDLCMVHQS